MKLEKEKIFALILTILGFVIVVDTTLEQFFSIGTKQDSFVLGYCSAFVLFSIKFPNLLKKKPVIIPMYIMVAQMLYSLIATYV